jgi:hypothetical protein
MSELMKRADKFMGDSVEIREAMLLEREQLMVRLREIDRGLDDLGKSVKIYTSKVEHGDVGQEKILGRPVVEVEPIPVEHSSAEGFVSR